MAFQNLIRIYTSPKGYADENSILHRKDIMRLATGQMRFSRKNQKNTIYFDNICIVKGNNQTGIHLQYKYPYFSIGLFISSRVLHMIYSDGAPNIKTTCQKYKHTFAIKTITRRIEACF